MRRASAYGSATGLGTGKSPCEVRVACSSRAPAVLLASAAVAALFAAPGGGATPAEPIPQTVPPERGAPTDVLVGRDGQRQTGELQSCVGPRCRFDNQTVAKDAIEWLGMGVRETTPPAVVHADQDELHLRDGSVRTGALVGISLGEVLLETGSFDRDQVTWLHLAGPPGAQAEGALPATGAPGTGQGCEGPGCPSPTPPLPPSKRPPPPLLPPPTPPPLAKGDHLVRGHLWSGTIHVHQRTTFDSGFTDDKSDIEARLREFPVPLREPRAGKIYGTEIRLEPEGAVFRSRFESRQGAPGSEGDECRGDATISVTALPGQAGFNHPSVIFVSRVDDDTTPWIGFPILRGKPRYVVSLAPEPTRRFSAACTSWSQVMGHIQVKTYTDEEPFLSRDIGRGFAGCEPSLQHVCDPEIRTLEGENGRMHGAWHQAWDEDEEHHDTEVRWSLCRDDVPCTEQPPEPESNPCGGTATQDALLQQCRDAEGKIADEMLSRWSTYQHDLGEAKPYLADFVHALAACTAWDTTELLLEAMLIAEVPSIGLDEEAAAELREFKEQLEFINRLLTAARTGDPLATLSKGETIKSLRTSAEAIEQFVETYHLMEHGEAEQFLEHLDECKAPISKATRDSAETYLLDMQRAMEDLDEYSKLANDFRAQNDQCLQAQWNDYVACVQNARCLEGPESGCAPLKPEGSWPDVP